jgi:hypothetical protein
MIKNTLDLIIKQAAAAPMPGQDAGKTIQETPGTAPTEVSTPVEDSENTEVTCMSDCAYAQNPEKRCQLKSISFSMSPEDGTFVCGQYMSSQPMQDPNSMQGQPMQGLDKVRPQAQPQQQVAAPTGLDKVK